MASYVTKIKMAHSIFFWKGSFLGRNIWDFSFSCEPLPFWLNSIINELQLEFYLKIVIRTNCCLEGILFLFSICFFYILYGQNFLRYKDTLYIAIFILQHRHKQLHISSCPLSCFLRPSDRNQTRRYSNKTFLLGNSLAFANMVLCSFGLVLFTLLILLSLSSWIVFF